MMNQMDHHQDYFSLESKRLEHPHSTGHGWPLPWDATPVTDMPLWQYTTAMLHQDGPPPSMNGFYPQDPPLSPYPDPRSASSGLSSPVTIFHHDGRFASTTPTTPIYDSAGHPSFPRPRPMSLRIPETTFRKVPEDDVMEDEDSESYSYDTNRSSKSPPPSKPGKRPLHRRTQSANEMTLKNAKRAHTVVERNYRERLNDKIADLALYLFETSSDARTKPSKSLVMTRAKERLKQLESRNKSLESEVVKLRQHIAILDHVVASKGGDGSVPSPL